MSVTLAEVLHGLLEKVHGWGNVPEHHAAIDAHFGEAPAAETSEDKPAE